MEAYRGIPTRPTAPPVHHKLPSPAPTSPRLFAFSLLPERLIIQLHGAPCITKKKYGNPIKFQFDREYMNIDFGPKY
jgi:hypothetical protein